MPGSLYAISKFRPQIGWPMPMAYREPSMSELILALSFPLPNLP
ncbi:hypothetical protein BVRB_7g162200 [Beta vulgaris subsp. vulgaris]|nr:hypothetical protein BVRB_7g162200 [Beta vulgaris subsp. vulgaris]